LLKIREHWLIGARHLLSPNFNDRPAGASPELIVVHNISLPPGEFGGCYIDLLFCNSLPAGAHPYFAEIKGLEVSSHFLVDRAGAITQYVACDKRAWHAGVSEWKGRSNCNDFSIGIELEGTDDIPYESCQYESLVMLVEALWEAYPSLQKEAVTGHEHIAPGRKTDPGASFDWERLWEMLG
jgi:AmpD protein